MVHGGSWPGAGVTLLKVPNTPVVCGEMTIGGDGEVAVNSGNRLAAVGTVALPVLYWISGKPAVDGGTAAAAIAGPTFGPTGTAEGGGNAGGGGLPMSGGGRIGTKAGNTSEVPVAPV